MKNLLLWFYCLSISGAFSVVVTITVIYFLFRYFFNKKRFWHLTIVVSFLLWLAVIAVATLADRTPAEIPAVLELIPFHSYRAVLAGENKEILRSNFMNVVLFYPVGLLACELLPKAWKRYRKILLIVLIFALLSAGIEVCQYHFALGQAEVDDVIHNTLGTLIGAVVSSIHISGHKLKSSD